MRVAYLDTSKVTRQHWTQHNSSRICPPRARSCVYIGRHTVREDNIKFLMSAMTLRRSALHVLAAACATASLEPRDPLGRREDSA